MATTCCARTSSGLRGYVVASMPPSTIRSATTAHCTRSPRYFGRITPVLTAPTWCPARPTRCRPDATDGGDSTCTTRSTAPMSMPSSRLDVATTAGSRPDFSASSISDRCSRDTLPWWARAISTVPSASTGRPVPDAPGCWAGPRWNDRPNGLTPAEPVRPVQVRHLDVRHAVQPLGGDLVQAAGEPLRETAAVAEHDGAAVLLDEVDDPLLDRRPDAAPRRRAGRRPAPHGPGLLADRAHVLDRHDDRDLDRLGRGRLHHGDLARAAEEAGDLVDRPHGGRQADPLRRLRQQGVEPLQRDGEVRAALGARDGVHLVEDHRLDPGQRLARGRRQHEEQRLRRRDEDVGRGLGEPAALLRRGVARAGADRDLRDGQVEPLGGLPDADQRGRAGCARRRRRAP